MLTPEPMSLFQTPPKADPDANPLYQGSFFRFLVLAFVLVSLPLLIGLMQLSREADELAKRSEETVKNVCGIVQDVQSLQTSVSQMERVFRHSIALSEAPILGDLAGPRKQFSQAAERLVKVALPAQAMGQLREIMGDEAALFEGASLKKALDDLPPEVERMGLALEKLAEAGGEAAAAEVQAMRERVTASKRQALLTLVAAVSLAIALAALFTVLLARPVRRIDRAIRRMGEGRLQDVIRIGGPSDVRLLGRRLDWLRVRLNELEADRLLLSQSLSHDLKTPLTSIHEGTDLLLQGVAGPLNPRQDEIVQIMRQSAHAMNSNIESLLTVRSGPPQIGPVALEPVALRSLITSVAELHELSARAKGLSISIAGPELHLSADPTKLRTVFDNMLSNAIRFSPSGGQVLFELSAQAGHARVEVSDEGVGIAADVAPRVFEPGYRAPNQPQPGVPTSGVGLTITREFVWAHGGSISVDPRGSSVNGQGAKFVIDLPGLTQHGMQKVVE
jgi:two-component system, NtrC family, sensor histidine kinase GlrK